MALITCKQCGGKVSDRAEKCPHCGCPIGGVKHCTECNAVITENEAVCPNCGHPTPWSRECPECGNYVLATEGTCPECGFDLTAQSGNGSIPYSAPVETQPSSEETYLPWEEEKPSKTKWFVIGGVALVAVAALVWWLLSRETPIMQCVIEDNKGTYYGEEGEEPCPVITYSHSEPFNIVFDRSVNFYGTRVREIYLEHGLVYNNKESFDPIGSYSSTINRGERTFSFYRSKTAPYDGVSLKEKLRQAKTKEEVVRLINGTTWYCTDASTLSGWLQVKFRNGRYIFYSAAPSDGKWTQTGSGTYTVSEGHFSDTGKKYVSIEWECEFKIMRSGTIPCEFYFFPAEEQIDVTCHTLYRANRAIGNYSPFTRERVYSARMHQGEYKW